MRAFVLFFSLFLISACGESTESKTGTTTSAEVPERVAVKFFEAILVENDIKKAQIGRAHV